MTRGARYFAPKIRYCTRKIKKKKKNNVATRESPCTSKTFYDIDFTSTLLPCRPRLHSFNQDYDIGNDKTDYRNDDEHDSHNL